MEGTSIAHACYLNHIPYVIIRAISDKADGSAEMNYPEFEKRAAEDCANITEQVLKLFSREEMKKRISKKSAEEKIYVVRSAVDSDTCYGSGFQLLPWEE